VAATIFANEPSRSYFIVGYVAAIAAAVAAAALAARSFRNRRAMLLIALFSATALPFLLPKMLERYYFLADVLALAVALSLRTRRATFVAVAVQLASLLSLFTYIYWYHWPYPALAAALFAAAGLAGMMPLLKESGARWPSLPLPKLRKRAELGV
jgi:hypothetical protein